MTDIQIGNVFFSQVVGPRTISLVRDAANLANFPENSVREIRPRNLFIRAIRQIHKDEDSQQLVHKINDDETFVQFQFTRFYVESRGVTYDPQAMISFDKETFEISCPHEETKQLAIKFYQEMSQVLLPSDIRQIVKKLVRKHDLREILLYDGVYYLPNAALSLLEQIKTFYKRLGFMFFTFPVMGESSKEEIVQAVIADMTKEVQAMTQEVRELKEANNLTARVASSRLNELSCSLQQFKVIAESLRVSADSIFSSAGDAGEAILTAGTDDLEVLISKVQSNSGKFVPLVQDLVEAAGEINLRELPIERISHELEEDPETLEILTA